MHIVYHNIDIKSIYLLPSVMMNCKTNPKAAGELITCRLLDPLNTISRFITV